MDINNLSKAKAKYIRSLHTLKHRQKYNKYIAEGHKICKEIIISNAPNIELIVATKSWVSENLDILHTCREKIAIGSAADLKQVSALSTPSEVLLVAEQPLIDDKVSLKKIDLTLYLDGIRNPGNMGAILRIADWYGIDTVFCSPDCVDVYNPKVIQSSMGSFLRIQTLKKDFTSLKAEGFAIVGTRMDGKTIANFSLPEKMLLVIGNEGKGVAEETRSVIDDWISIDGSKRLGAESLNAAVATGILIDQLQHKKG